MAFAADEEAAEEHAQWWHSDMKEKIDTHPRKDPGASFIMDGGGPALYAWVAEECGRISGQDSTENRGRALGDLARMAEVRELEAWGQFEVFSPERLGAQLKDLVDTRWMLT